jgi:hypothetical protein
MQKYLVWYAICNTPTDGLQIYHNTPTDGLQIYHNRRIQLATFTKNDKTQADRATVGPNWTVTFGTIHVVTNNDKFNETQKLAGHMQQLNTRSFFLLPVTGFVPLYANHNTISKPIDHLQLLTSGTVYITQ